MADSNDKDTVEQLKARLAEVEAEKTMLETSFNMLSQHFEELTQTQTLALSQSRDDALSASKTKSEFLANMSHEIRTPLTAIMGFAHSLADKSLNTHDVELATAAIIRNSRHLMSIVNDILDLAKIEQHQFDLEQVPFDLFELVHQVRESLVVQAIEKNLAITVNHQFPQPTQVTGDPTRVRQVLYNLVNNALKFTHEGGVTLTTSYDTQAQSLQISVEDTGIGIPPAKQHKIFEPFSQADTTTTRRYGGTGLGLTICHRLAQLMNGDLHLQSEPGKGSRFDFSFAVGKVKPDDLIDAEPQSKSSQTGQATSTPGLSGRILVAEDSQDTRNLVALYIRHTGAEVVFVNDGQQAVEKALAEDFNLVLMDLQMPVVDGFEATTLLRQVGFQKPIIAFTANLMPEALDQARSAGCNGHIGKPIDKVAFYQLLAKYLPPGDHKQADLDQQSLIDDMELARIRRNFIERAPQLYDELSQTLTQQAWQDAKILLHTFKGTCGSLGFNGLYTRAGQLEQLLSLGQYDTVIRSMDTLRHQIQQALNQLQQENPAHGQ